MRSYPLRASSVCGKYMVPFSLKDGPIPLDDNTFALSEIPNSPILTYESILRGCDIEDLFAGDIVTSNGKDYLISYHRGLVGRSLDDTREVLYFDDIGKITMVSNIYNREAYMSSRQSTFPYKYKNDVFYLQDIYGIQNGMLRVNIKGGLLVPIEEAQQYAGVRGPESELVFFGDYGTKLVRGQIIANINGEEVNITKGGKFNE